MDIMGYAKAHPWLTGIIVVIGAIVFFAIVRGGSGGSSGAPSGPSDAQVAASAAIQQAQIAQQGQLGVANAQVQAAQIGAGVQLNSDNKQAEIAMAQIEAAKALGFKTLEVNATTAQSYFQADQTTKLAAINNIGKFKGANGWDEYKAAALQTIFSGQNAKIPTPESFGQKGPDNAGDILGGIGSVLGSVLSIFSDASLKENIKYEGQDKRGYGRYSFNYKGSTRRRTGVIAQDLARSHPEAVIVDNNTGRLMVNPFSLLRDQFLSGPAMLTMSNPNG